MGKHAFVFLKDNKLWIIKALLILFAIISCIIFFIQYVQYGVRKYNTCTQIHPFLLSFGLLSIFFTICSTTIIFLQWRKSTKIGYAHLEKDKEIEREQAWEREVEMELEQQEEEEKQREDEAVGKLQKIFKISCFTFTIVSSLFLVAILIAFSVVQNSFLPQINGNLRLKGLLADATIEREPNGVLHIKANNEHDMYFAQGVAMAQERLWEMEFFRRVGNGSLSEVLGNATFETDLLFRTLGLRKAAEASIDDLSPDGAMAMNAFVQGINSYLETNPKLPAEFKLLGFKPAPFVAADSAIMIKILGIELAGNYWRELFYHKLKFGLHLSDSDIDSLSPEYPENAPTILDDEDIKHINFTYEFDPITSIRQRSFDKQYNSFPFENSKKIEKKISVEKLMKQSGILQGYDMSFKSASNNWVINGNRSNSGKPLLCNDPHLTISAPSIWVMMHLESPGVSVVGVTPCGAPAITLGRNSDIAWGVTNTFIDVQDIYILEEDKNETGYYHNSEFIQYGHRHEIIKIKGEEDFILNVRESIYGPVISDIMETEGQTAAFRWVALDDNDTTFNALIELTKAKTFEEFRTALRSYVGPSQNFVFADINGNIGYQCPGRIPARAPGHTGRFPVAGNGTYDWIGWIKYDELPYVLNPSKGYIVSANNKITPPSYPYLLLNNHDWEAHYRALSITEMIEKTNQNTITTMREIQYNTVTGLWRDFKPYLSKIPDNLLDDNGVKWKGKLASWNGNTTADSLDATVFEYWVFYLGRLGSKAGFYSYGEPYFILNSLATNSCGSSDCIRYLAGAFSQAVTIGADREWGDVHRLIIEHPIMSQSPLSCVYDRELRSGGDVYTINIGAFSSSVTEETSNPFDSYHGPSYRQIVDLSNMENSEFIIPMGNSGNVLDKNYDNMNNDFFSGKYYGMKTKDYKVAHTLTLK